MTTLPKHNDIEQTQKQDNKTPLCKYMSLMYSYFFPRRTSSSAKNLTKFIFYSVREAKSRYIRSICSVFLMIIAFKPQQFFIGKITATEHCKFIQIDKNLESVSRLFLGYSIAIRVLKSSPIFLNPCHFIGFSVFLCNSPPVFTR